MQIEPCEIEIKKENGLTKLKISKCSKETLEALDIKKLTNDYR